MNIHYEYDLVHQNDASGAAAPSGDKEKRRHPGPRQRAVCVSPSSSAIIAMATASQMAQTAAIKRTLF
jgi:hypothetical protein